MSLFNEIQVGRFNRFAQKLLSMKGPPSMPTLATDLQFVHPIDSGVENKYPQGWDTFAFSNSVTALAANKQVFELRNPSASNVAAVITRAAFLDVGNADNCSIIYVRKASATDQGTIAVPPALDGRGRPGSSCILSFNQGTAVVSFTSGTSSGVFQIGAGVNVPLELLRPGDELPLMPGDAYYLLNGVNSVACIFTFFWRERLLEDSERA